MLIDKKREKMYFECLLRKKSIDKKLAVTRAILLVPPLLLLIGVILMLFMLMFSDAFTLFVGAIWYGYKSKGAGLIYLCDLLVYGGYIFMALNLTVYKTERFLRNFPFIYGVATAFFFIVLIIFGYSPIYVALGVVSLLTGFANKKLIEEDKEMSKLEGYPHFKPTYMRDLNATFTPATTEELDGMTAEERIMYEREH